MSLLSPKKCHQNVECRMYFSESSETIRMSLSPEKCPCHLEEMPLLPRRNVIVTQKISLSHKCHCHLENVITTSQGTINCAILGPGIGRSGDPRRKWKEMGEQERERQIYHFEKCSFCLQNDLKDKKKNDRNARSVYILPLQKPVLRHLSRLSKKSYIRFMRK